MTSPASLLKRLLVGRAVRSDRLQHTLLPKRIALPVFASDPMSSVAYAPAEILLMLSVGGLAAYAFAPWVALVVVLVLLTVVASYRQNVRAYPSGGGDYEVATVNLGRPFGLVVASALLVDYVLTVAVSVSSGINNLGSAVPFVAEHRVGLAVTAVVVLTAMNLRGVRESGGFFAVPTYLFMAAILGMCALINIVLALILIPSMGLLGAALATVIACGSSAAPTMRTISSSAALARAAGAWAISMRSETIGGSGARSKTTVTSSACSPAQSSRRPTRRSIAA